MSADFEALWANYKIAREAALGRQLSKKARRYAGRFRGRQNWLPGKGSKATAFAVRHKFAVKPRPKTGLDCLMCAIFARQPWGLGLGV